jgi:DNA-binding Xre family transcriptional regulator
MFRDMSGRDKTEDLYRKLLAARRRRGMTQSELAVQTGCRQSAISMMERGKPDALSWQKLEAVAALLDVDISDYATKKDDTVEATKIPATSVAGICPVFDCPSNLPFVVNGRLLVLPRTTVRGGERHCAYCGELLESLCPECGAPVVAGRACCGECGAAYITVPQEVEGGGSMHEWATRQRRDIAALGIGVIP